MLLLVEGPKAALLQNPEPKPWIRAPGLGHHCGYRILLGRPHRGGGLSGRQGERQVALPHLEHSNALAAPSQQVQDWLLHRGEATCVGVKALADHRKQRRPSMSSPRNGALADESRPMVTGSCSSWLQDSGPLRSLYPNCQDPKAFAMTSL